MRFRIQSPVTFDTNILLTFRRSLLLVCQFFEVILIHEQVYQEVLDDELRTELNKLSQRLKNVKFVSDEYSSELDDSAERLYHQCQKELKQSFNVENKEDLGEYKTLLYAKFMKITLVSTQDTTVWRMVKESVHFKGIQCITVQDIAYMIFINAENKKLRNGAKGIYNQYTSQIQHPFQAFKRYMERQPNPVPNYIDFERGRVTNYQDLLQGYVQYYPEEIPIDIESQIVKEAKESRNSCLNCLNSRINLHNIDYKSRTCLFNLKYDDDRCKTLKDEFDCRIAGRD